MSVKRYIGIGLVGLVILLGLFIVAWFQARTRAAVAVTTVQLVNYMAATTNFLATAGRWPTSATELVTNSMGIIFILPWPHAHDGWGRQIIYEPYTTNTGRGRVLSYGRDGKVGGVG